MAKNVLMVEIDSEFIEEVNRLRAELDLAIAERDALLSELATALNYIATQDAENTALRATLSTIAQGIDPYEDQLQNWIAGQIDTALKQSQLS